MTRTNKELIWILPLLWVLVIAPFWQLAVGQGIVITNDVGVSDIANLQYPLRYFAGQQWRQGHIPLWTPGVYMGYPFLAEGQAGVFSPVNLLLFSLFPVPYALNIGSLLPFIIAATGAYLLARRLGASIAGAFLAGFGYALSGFYIAHVKHIPIVATAAWIPILLWLIERGIKHSDRSLLLAGLVLALQWLSGSPQMAYYSTGVAILYFAGRAWQQRRVRSLRRIVPLFGIALALSAGMAAVQLLPTYQLVGFSERSGGVSLDFATRFSYAVENLKTFLYPLANGTPGTGDLRISSIFWEDYAYAGLIPLFLGVIGGAVLARRSGVARLLMALMLLTFLVVLGPATPAFDIAFRIVPGLSFFRFPQRLLAFTLLFLMLLAGLALTGLQTRLKGRRAPDFHWKGYRLSRSHVITVCLLLLVLADLYAYHWPWNAIVNADTWLAPPSTAQAMAERAGTDLYRVYTFDVYNTFRAAYRAAGGWRGDLTPYIEQREFLQPSLNLIYGVSSADGYVNLVPDDLAALWGTEKQLGLMDQAFVETGDQLQPEPEFLRLFGLYNVRFLITPGPAQDPDLELVGVYGPGAYLYENHQTMPRVYAVPQYTPAADRTEALRLLLSPSFDPTQSVVLTEPPQAVAPPAADFQATVDVVSYEPNQVSVRATLNNPGWLVLSDTYYPGWEATVDGRPAPIYEANAGVRAVYMDKAGQHQVDFRFRPGPFYTGAAISAASLVLWLAALGVISYIGSARQPSPTPADTSPRRPEATRKSRLGSARRQKR